MSISYTDIAIIGAGPNGLGLASHLSRRGLDFRIFGSPMETWRAMPDGMCLKSLGFATTIPTPDGYPTFPQYCRAKGLEDYEPIEFATFADYGMQLQRDLVPEVEDVKVAHLRRANGRFVLILDDGERVTANTVVVAVGLTYFPQVPHVFDRLPSGTVAHTWGRTDFASYTGQDVVVIGGGSSALETATLLYEHGARVQVLARGDVYWGGRTPRDTERTLVERVKLPVTSLGHGRENWVLQHAPGLMYHVPSSKRLPFTARHLGPAPAWWLRNRAEGKFPIFTRTQVFEAARLGNRVRLRLAGPNGPSRNIEADRIVAGTGYRFDIDKISFIDASLARQLDRHDLSPKLSRHFESTAPGLYFVGPVAAESFGPLVRFVAGAPFTVSRVTGRLRRQAPRRAVYRPRQVVANPDGAAAVAGNR
jgi:FAD-dependent urate hydroxylase